MGSISWLAGLFSRESIPFPDARDYIRRNVFESPPKLVHFRGRNNIIPIESVLFPSGTISSAPVSNLWASETEFFAQSAPLRGCIPGVFAQKHGKSARTGRPFTRRAPFRRAARP